MDMKFAWPAAILSMAGLLAGCGIGAAGDEPTRGFTGSVMTKAPLSGATLTVIDSSTPAKTFTVPTMADGSYSVDVSNGIAPFLFHAHGLDDGKPVDVYSASPSHGGKVDISPLTSLVVASATGQDCATTACTPSILTAANLIDADMKVQRQLAPLLTQFGLAIAEALDSKYNTPVMRKLVHFKHIAVGGFVYSRDPLEFIKNRATGNWRLTDSKRRAVRTRAGKTAVPFAPLPGASTFGKWLSFAKESGAYPYGATLITVRGPGNSPAVTLEYSGRENGATRVAGAAIVEAVAGVSFLPACPRPARQPGACIEVTQGNNGEFTAAFSDPDAVVREVSANNVKRTGARITNNQ